MCIAIYKPTGVAIKDECLYNGWKANKDGCGYCFVDENDKIIIKTMMKYSEFTEQYYHDVHKYGNTSPFLIHFRITSKGNTSLENCHPFRINDEMALIHNGTITNMNILNGDTRSDTYYFATKYMATIGINFKNIVIWELLESYIGWSKVCILTTSREVYILNKDKGEWSDGIWYSNGGYISPVTKYPINKYKTTTYTEDTDWDWSGTGGYGRTNTTLWDWCEECKTTVFANDLVYHKERLVCRHCRDKAVAVIDVVVEDDTCEICHAKFGMYNPKQDLDIYEISICKACALEFGDEFVEDNSIVPVNCDYCCEKIEVEDEYDPRYVSDTDVYYLCKDCMNNTKLEEDRIYDSYVSI